MASKVVTRNKKYANDEVVTNNNEVAKTQEYDNSPGQGEWISDHSKAVSSYDPNYKAGDPVLYGSIDNTPIYGGSSGSSSSKYSKADIFSIPRTASLQGLPLGDLYGITYDQNAIENIYNQATDAAYALKQREMDMAENQYYRNLYDTQNTTVDALRAQRNDQIASGMSAGLAAAAEAATAMGIQEEGAAGALEIANDRQKIADELAAEYAQNAVKAFDTSNNLKTAIGQLDLAKYGHDTTFDSTLPGALALLIEAQYNSDATRYASDNQFASDKYRVDADNIAAMERLLTGNAWQAEQNDKDRANALRIANLTSGGYGNNPDSDTKTYTYPDLVKEYTDKNGIVNLTGLRGELASNSISDGSINSIIDDLTVQNMSKVPELCRNVNTLENYRDKIKETNPKHAILQTIEETIKSLEKQGKTVIKDYNKKEGTNYTWEDVKWRTGQGLDIY